MLDSSLGYLKEIEQTLRQLRMLGTLSYNASRSSTDSEPTPDWCESSKMIVSLAEQGLEAWTDLYAELAGDHGQKKKSL